jgi:TonB family protein
MSFLLTLTLRTSAILLVGLGARAALRKKAAACRHVVLAGSLAAAAAVAPLSLVLPSWDVSVAARFRASPPIDSRQVAPRSRTLAVAPSDAAGDRQRPDISARSAIARVWLAGFLAFATVLVGGVLRLARVASRAPVVNDRRWLQAADAVAGTYGVRRRIVVRQTHAPDLLATYGVFRPSVLLPSHAREWPDDRIYVVLCHELAHVRRFDWPIQIGAEAVRTLLWFNPLVWLACTYLRRDSEAACDDLVLERGVAARDYASHLVELARKCRRSPGIPLPAIPMARRSTLERRIAAMLNPRLDRRPLSIRTVVTATALLLAVTVATATVRAVQTGPATLSGTVYDTTGGVMPGVAIALEDVTQMKYTATTDTAGRFAFSNVQPGHYTLEASLPGFRTLNQQFDLTARRDWDRAITLQVGTLKETITVSTRRTASPAASPATLTPLRVGGNIRAPLKTHDVRPVYPASMRDAGREGIVPIEAIIGVDGTVTSVRILSADVHPDFALAAADAVRQWRFTPTLLNGSPVEVVMTVSVTFTLSDQ